jgi:hypothetical protein
LGEENAVAQDPPGAERRFARTDAEAERRRTDAPRGGERRTGLYWLFLIPAAGTLLPWIFKSGTPELIGIPFFYWYLMAWIPVTVLMTALVYRATKGPSS